MKEIYAQNEKKYQEMLYEKYNPNKMFKKKEEIITNRNINQEKNTKIIEYKESVFKKIKNKIFIFLHLR